MLEQVNENRILFLDIETVAGKKSFNELSEPFQKLWTEKTKFQRKDEHTPEEFYELRGGILAEFSKVVCISVGFIPEHTSKFRAKSFFGDDEKELLSSFSDFLKSDKVSQRFVCLCAHNGKEFDFPVLARRMVINGIEMPPQLNIAGKKPWEIPHLDTMELWKFGDFKNYTSIKLLTAVLDIPSPKDDIDGSEVSRVYYEEHDLDRIARYCEKDTLAVAQIIMRFKRLPLLEMEKNT